MLSVQTLGAFHIRGADGRPLPVGRQPKRQAVLLYLLLARPYGLHRRDSVLGLFWPEATRTRGSHSLSQALNWLTRVLGPEAIVRPSSDEVGIDEAVVSCDAREFAAALAAGDAKSALELYRGEVAPGLYVQRAPEFERWLEAERRHLQSCATEAAAGLVSTARQRGDDGAALRWANRWQELDPYSEAALREVVEVHVQRGDPAAAVLAYDVFAKRMAADLELTPSSETAERIAELRRSHAAVERVASGAAVAERQRATARAEAMAMPTEAPAGTAVPVNGRNVLVPVARAQRRFRFVLAAVVLLVLVAFTLVRRLPGEGDPVAAQGDPRIAVMFFNDDSQTQDLGSLAAGITLALTHELASLDGLEVVTPTAMRTFQGRHPPLDTLQNVLQARWIIAGSLSSSGEMYRVSAELIDATTGTGTPIPRIERPHEEVFALIDAIVRDVSAGLRDKLGREIRHDGWMAGTTPKAWMAAIHADRLRLDAVAESRQEARLRLLARADSFATQAIAEDRRWAEAWVLRGRIAEHRALLKIRAGDVAAMRQSLTAGLGFADSALAHGEHAGAYELRGTLLVHAYLFTPPSDADSAVALLAAGERDLTRALELDRRRPLAEARLAMSLDRQGRFEEAFAALQRALALDVFLQHAGENASNMFAYAFHMGDDDEAANWCDEVRRIQGESESYTSCRLLLLAFGRPTGQAAQLAEYDFERARERVAGTPGEAVLPVLAMKFAAALARAGEGERAREVIDEWRDRTGPVRGDLLELEAAAWTALGEPDTAIDRLRRALEARPASRARILAMRYFRSLKHLPEFQALYEEDAR